MKTVNPLLSSPLTDLTGLVPLVAELHVLAVDDGLLLAGLTAGARLHHGLGVRGQGGGEEGRDVVTAGE